MNHIDTVAFQNRLHAWFEKNARPMPWRETEDPYRIWLSEVILQQTRVEQGWSYYERFAERFPTVQDLAAASQDDVLKAWEGLGYYSRARNLHAAARQVVDSHGGKIPARYDTLLKLPGIGPYTAAAVASIAFGEAAAVLDGNVIRVLSRISTLNEDVTRSPVRRKLQTMADALLDTERPGLHNEAMMELGATVCSPTRPDCDNCPASAWCMARQLDVQESYPVKKKKAPVPHYDISVGVVLDERQRVLIQKRPDDAMLGGLWEFPGGKQQPGESAEQAAVREIREETGLDVIVEAPLATVKHAYSHFRITLSAFTCRPVEYNQEPSSDQPIKWVARDELADYAFPRANRKLIDALASRDGS